MQISKLISAALATLLSTSVMAGAIFNSDSYIEDITFSDALQGTTMTVAFDGTNYWSTSGGSSGGQRLAQYNANGDLISTFSPGIDFRSVFTDNSGNVFARGYASANIYQLTAPGVFSNYLSLSGGSLDAQSSVVFNKNNEFVAMENGNVNVWNASGNLTSSFTLTGYSGTYPQNRGIISVGDFLVTYKDQLLSAWDYSGNLVDQAALVGAGTSFDSYFSLSYANDRVFINDNAGQTWRGYNIGIGANDIPEPNILMLFALAVAGIAISKRKKSS